MNSPICPRAFVWSRPSDCSSRAANGRSVTSDYVYDLPEGAIALTPADPADESRLMFLSEAAASSHHRFRELPDLLRPSDLLVINETRVIRARLRGTRVPGGGAAEILLLRPLDRFRYDAQARRWEALVRPARRLGVGRRVEFGEDGCAEVVGVQSDAVREVALDLRIPLPEFLERHGKMPLPPYVREGDEASRRTLSDDVRARPRQRRSADGFTAFHAARLRRAASARRRDRRARARRRLRDVQADRDRAAGGPRDAFRTLRDLRCAARAVNGARKAGRRIVAAGTTVLRALESAALAASRGMGLRELPERFTPASSETSLFIRPGFEFKIVDVLLTNFHLPASTLLVLVAAFAGYERAIERLPSRHCRGVPVLLIRRRDADRTPPGLTEVANGALSSA